MPAETRTMLRTDIFRNAYIHTTHPFGPWLFSSAFHPTAASLKKALSLSLADTVCGRKHEYFKKHATSHVHVRTSACRVCCHRRRLTHSFMPLKRFYILQDRTAAAARSLHTILSESQLTEPNGNFVPFLSCFSTSKTVYPKRPAIDLFFQKVIRYTRATIEFECPRVRCAAVALK